MHLRVCRDDALDQRRPASGLTDNKYRCVTVMAITRAVHPLAREHSFQRRERLDFSCLVIVDRAAARFRAFREGRERGIPFLEVLEFLAKRVIEKGERLWRVVAGCRELLHFIHMRPVPGLAQPCENPVRVSVVGMLGQDFPQRGLGRIELADEHLAVGVVDAVHDVVGFGGRGPLEPGQRFFILTDQRVHGPDQIVDDSVTVLVLDGFLQRGIRQCELPAECILAGKMGPRRPMIGLQLRHRAKSARRDAALVQLDGHEPHEEMCFWQLRVVGEDTPAALRGPLGLAGLQVRKSAVQQLTLAILVGSVFHIVNICEGAAILHDRIGQNSMRKRG